MALPTVPSTGGDASSAGVTAKQFDDLIQIQSAALSSLKALEGALVKSASQLAEERLERMNAAASAAAGPAAGAAASAGGGGLLKGIGKGMLGAGLGVAAALAGAGIGAAGIAFLIDTLAKPGLGEGIRKNVEELLAINEGNARTLEAVKFAAIFGSIGAGLLVFGVGKTAVGIGNAIETFNKKFGGKPFAEGVKHDVETLLSIDTGGAGKIVAFAPTMTIISAGLIAFTAGTTIAALGHIVKGLAEKVEGSGKTMAEVIKDDIETLLSITIPAGVNVPDIRKTMTNLGLGMAAFGAGTTIAAISKVVEGLAKAVKGLPEGMTLAEAIVKDMEALMAIQIPEGGVAQVGDVSSSMRNIAKGLAAFGAASAGAGLGAIISGLAEKVQGLPEGRSLAQQIVIDMEALMNIKIPEKGMPQVKDVQSSMTNIAKGMAAFGAASGVAGLGGVVSGLAVKVQGLPEGRSLAQQIVIDMEALMNIQIPEKGMPQVKDVSESMKNISKGMMAFGGGEFVAGIGGIVGALGAKVKGSDKSLAQHMVADMEALMGIQLPESGMAQVGDIEQSMKNMSKGMMAFGTGEAVASLGAIVGGLAQKVTGSNKTVAESMADDMAALLAIQLPAEGMSKVGDIEQSMKNMAKGMAAFGAGIGIASIGDIVETLAKKVGDSDKTIAESIKEDVELLTSINVTTMQSSGFEQSMKDISKGLAVFAGGKALVSIGSIIEAFSQKLGNDPWTEAIKKDVNNLMTLVGDDPDAEIKKSAAFITIMDNIKQGLNKFTGATFVSNLQAAFGAVVSWISGEDSPIQQAITLAQSADELDRVGAGLEKAARGLKVFSSVEKMKDLDLEDFAKDLAPSVPVIEKAIMGGALSSGWLDWGNNNIKFEGLANPNVKYEDAARNMQALGDAMLGNFKGMVERGTTVPGEGGVIEAMTIRTAIIQSAVIQGPSAQAFGGIAGGGGGGDTNVVTVMGASNSSVSAMNTMSTSPGTSNPMTAVGPGG